MITAHKARTAYFAATEREGAARQERETLEAQERRARILKAKHDAPDLLETYAEGIQSAASTGSCEFTIEYRDEKGIEYEAVAEEARLRGFLTRLHSQVIDHGDSAAPYRVTHHYLTLNWYNGGKT